MKTSTLCFLFFVLCSDSWAQLTCTHCTFSGTETTTTPATILTSPAAPFTGDITLTGDSQFVITGAGNYILSGRILGNLPATDTHPAANHSLTLIAPGTTATGYTAGLTFSGTQANNYGSTTINSGYIICNKSQDVLAIPGHVNLNGSTVQTHLWCLANNNQLSESTVVNFTGTTISSFALNGTTQTIAGLVANNGGAVVENNEADDSLPAVITAALSTHPATLNINAGTVNRTYGGGAHIRKGGTTAGTLTVHVMTGTQIIQNPGGHITNVTLTTEVGATLELNTGSGDNQTLGTNVTFGGGGILKKTGGKPLVVNGATYLKTAGKILLSNGIWRSQGTSRYAVGSKSNKATLQMDTNGVFDISGNATTFSGLTGVGFIVNDLWQGVDGYADLIIDQNNTATPATFDGVINDNLQNESVSQGENNGGIHLRKDGAGTQVLTSIYNGYTGSTTVSGGTLKLEGNGQLGEGTYGGALEISNVSEDSPAVFEHNGTLPQVFNGPMTSTGTGGTKGIFRQSGTGKSIINGVNTFSGQVEVTGGFLGGTGNLKNATLVTVGAAIISAGNGTTGGTLTVSGLSLTAASKLIVNPKSDTDNAPSLIDVKARTTDNPGIITVAGRFTVDVLSANLVSGLIIRCTNGLSGSLLEPRIGQNNIGKSVTFNWTADGLYMTVTAGGAGFGLSCNNCSFSSGGENKTGTPTTPAFILTSPDDFTGDITLNGDCQFTLAGAGNYILSGRITGNHSLTLNAPGVAGTGYTAGLTFSGTQANDYGSTTINSGYIICSKSPGVQAIPGNIKLAGTTVPSHLWCLADNQLSENTTVDFTDTTNSYFALNATTQTIAGLMANTAGAVVENNGAATSRPAGMRAAQVIIGAATLNIKAGTGSYIYGGGAHIRKGGTAAAALTVYVMTGTQIIQNPDGNINNVTLTAAEGATLEFNTTGTGTYTLGQDITFEGGGTIKKTGAATLFTNGVTYLKTAGKIWVSNGIWGNQGPIFYSKGGENNNSTLQVEEGNIYDLAGKFAIFGGLTGNGSIHNNLGQNDGYVELTINQNNMETPATFSGTIKNNQTDNPVSGNGSPNGGIHLRKDGAGTQVLTGLNTYTGYTRVSAGTLKLQGEGRLGTRNQGGTIFTGTCEGAIEIYNVEEAASQATFEHNGTQPQVFNGPITNNTGTGVTKGIFLQSGSGKSIISGDTPKSFTGHVNITGGFLGGSGDLRNATSVNVGAGGSIGGGDKVADNGDTLTVANLTFATADSKLIVTTTAGSTPGLSLVEVKTGAGTPGAITAANGFKVELTGTNPVSGYILKCSNGGSLQRPTVELPANSPLAGKVGLNWDAVGLWMQISAGTITLGTVSSVCPKGTNADNPVITVTATYSEESDLPSSFAGGYFTLSNNGAKSGDISVSKAGKIITAQFDGANTTEGDLSYTITYDDHRNAVVTSGAQRINRLPALSLSTGTNPTCIGTPLVLQATAGNRAVTITSSDPNKATVGDISATKSAAITTKVPGNVNFWATDADGCKSGILTVLLNNTIPVITPANPSVHTGGTLLLSADQEPVTTPAWVIVGTGATLEDPTPADGKKINFKAGTTAKNVTVEYTGQGCKATTSVTIKEAPPTGDPTGSASLSAFPIPAHDRLTIINDDNLQYITISDISGKTVMGEAVNGREAVLSIGHLADGIYLLRVIDSKGVRRLKIGKN